MRVVPLVTFHLFVTMSTLCKSTSSEELDASYDADSVLAFSALCFFSLLSSLSITSLLPSIIVVGPHRSLLSPGPI